MTALADWLWQFRDDRRRTAKRLPQLQAADIVFASHAKSGRTWLRVLISHVWHLTRGMPEKALLDFDNFHTLDQAIPKVFFTSDLNEPTPIRKRLPAIVAGKKLLLMVRDPRDVAVSYFFHHAKRSNERVHARLGMPKDLSAVELSAFVMAEGYGLPKVVDFMNRWERLARDRADAMLVRYEDLRADTAPELDRVMRFLGEAAPPEAIRSAVEFASFEALKEKERQRFFESERIQARDTDDPDSFKVRRGKVGGYRDYFTADEIAPLDHVVATRLDPALGYHRAA